MILRLVNGARMLRYRLRHKHWCRHQVNAPGQWIPGWPYGGRHREDGWHMIDCGMRQVRFCAGCGRSEFR